MFQVRIHGRGGQGVVSGAEMLSIAAFSEGRHAQAFPSFGSERMGAPVTAFCRIDHKPIRLRDPVTHPHALIIQDPTLLHQMEIFSGLDPEGYIVINTTRDLVSLGLSDFARNFPKHHVCSVPASDIALKHVGRPLPNAALLGGFAAITGELDLESVAMAIREKFTGKVAEANVNAATAAHEFVKLQLGKADAQAD